MKKIISVDFCKLNYKPELIFDAISDVTVYKEWAGENVKVEVLYDSDKRVGSKVEIHALGGWFKTEIISMNPPNEVRIKYYEGVQKGEGLWKIENAGNNESILTYSIDLEPVGFLPRFLSEFMDFSKMHSKAMMDMFQNLDKYLSSLKNF